jgi:C4-dicarboxylate-specific signal transduction histidine kinase
VRLVDINRLVEHALQFRRYYLSRARIDVSVVPLDPPSLVRADGSDLLQIMLNLLINAEQAVQGQPSARIELLATRAGHDIELTVSDNGPGLEADLESVTARPFFTTKSGAAGLGLTIAATLTRLNGGTLRLERGNHGGAVAVVTFPTAT